MTAPDLALATCARRLAAVDDRPGAWPRAPEITWSGPAGYPPDRPWSEATVQAACGIMEVNGRDRGVPRRAGIELASVAAGLLAAQGALAGAVGAARRGRPAPAVRTSVLQAGLLLLSHYFVVATGLGDAVPGPPLPAPGPPFRSADGHWFEIETLDAEPWKDFWTALGVPDAELGRAWTVFRWRYERATCSLPATLHAATAGRSLAQLRRAATAAEVSLTPLRGYAEVLADIERAVAHPVVRPAGASGPPTQAPAAAAGGDGDLPLAGIRVVEATSRIQGPFAGMLLRMLGAQVTRIQPPVGDYGRAARCLHRGKEAVRLDLATPSGRADLVDLVAGADVFLHNWRPGKAAEWGLEAADLSARHPGLVYVTTSGWGDRPQAGELVGTDFLVQAYAGVGGGMHPEGDPAVPSRLVLSDVFGGLLGAEGVLTGLLRRERAGGSWEVRSSLLAGAMALQDHVLAGIAGDKETGRRDGRPVWGVLDRPLATADGALVVSAEDDETFGRACRVCGVDPAGGPRPHTEQAVAARLGRGPAAAWEQALLDAGVPAAVVAPGLAAVAADPRLAGMFEPVGIGGVAPMSPWTFG